MANQEYLKFVLLPLLDMIEKERRVVENLEPRLNDLKKREVELAKTESKEPCNEDNYETEARDREGWRRYCDKWDTRIEDVAMRLDAEDKQLATRLRNRAPEEIDYGLSPMKFDISLVEALLKEVLGLPTEPSHQTSEGPSAQSGKSHTAKKERPHSTLDQRMKLLLSKNSEAIGWTVRRFAQELKCSVGGVHSTDTWKILRSAHESGRIERRKDRRRK